MTKSNLLKLSALSLMVAAGLASGCGDDTKLVWVPDPDETAGSNSAGKAGSTSSAGQSSTAGEPATDDGGAGSAGAEADGGEAGEGSGGTAGVSGGSGGTAGGGAGTGGTGGSAGKAGGGGSSGTGGSAGKAGGGGTSGSAGTAGSGGKAGSGGTGGASGGAGGSGGKAGGGGSAGSGGAAAVLFTPASTTCAAGNVQLAFGVCRNCHGATPTNGAPISLVTFADISSAKTNVSNKLNAGTMPPAGGGTLTPADKTLILNWIAAGAVGVPNTNGICP